MLWVYDDAIVKDLSNCIDPTGGLNSTVKLMNNVGGILGVLAQIQDDKLTFPAIFLDRHSDTPLDPKRFNFARTHSGVATCFDPETNNVYIEKMIPIDLKYDLHVLTTNTADMDEVTRELLFRYSSMYYLTIEIPYESKRKLRFGVAINPDTPIRKEKGSTDYETYTIYESIIELECQGAVLVSYTPRHLERVIAEDVVLKHPQNLK